MIVGSVIPKASPTTSGSGGDINPTNLTIVEDRYRDNSFYAVLDTIITSIKERFDENYLAMILCEKLFLTKIFLVEDELRSIAQFYI